MTPFPCRASDVIALTVPEFTSDPQLNASGSVERVCQRFFDDANRALVWFIRFRALSAWRDRPDMSAWLQRNPTYRRHASDIAASFALNDDWEFDAEPFRSAVESAAGIMNDPG